METIREEGIGEFFVGDQKWVAQVDLDGEVYKTYPESGVFDSSQTENVLFDLTRQIEG